MSLWETKLRGRRKEFDEARAPLDHATDDLARVLSNRGRCVHEVVAECSAVVQLCDALLPRLPAGNYPGERENFIAGVGVIRAAAHTFVAAELQSPRITQHTEVIPHGTLLACSATEEPLMYALAKYRRVAALPGEAGEEYNSPIESYHPSWQAV